MKLYEAIAKINKKDLDSEYDVDVFTNKLGIEAHWLPTEPISQRLKYVYLVKWYCTDTWVGTKVYFLDDIPVAISYQSGRKSDEEIDFLSLNDVQRMRDFIFSLMQDTEKDDKIMVCDLNKEIAEYYQVDYGSQLLTKEGFYQGRHAQVVQTWDGYKDINSWRKIRIEYKNEHGNTLEEIIDLSEFDIPLNLMKD